MKTHFRLKSIGRFSLVLSIVSFVGCATLDQVSSDIKKATAPVAITDTLAQICQAAKSNKAQAESLYVGKSLTTNGIVKSIDSDYMVDIKGGAGWRVFLTADKVGIGAWTKNKASVTPLVVGKTAKVSGVVESVTNADRFVGCVISLGNATF